MEIPRSEASQLFRAKAPILSSCRLVSAVLGLAALMFSGLVRPATAADIFVGKDVAAASRVAIDKVDHAGWADLLGKYVDEDGMVDYAGWKKSASAMKQLDDYIELLSAAKTSEGSRDAQLAFWINAYNAVTVKGILREYPTSSIRNHTAKLWGYNIWKNLKLRVDGKALSLDDIEHKILRKAGEPRIHFAIVCASIGCPRLLATAYVADELDEQLTANAKHFFSDSTKLQVDRSAKRLRVSPILSWFAEDFGASTTEQLATIEPYLPRNAQELVDGGGVTISYLDYDWGLNARN